MFGDLADKRVLVTGASTGIGAATAKLFASYGAITGIHFGSSKMQAQAVAHEIAAEGGRCVLVQGDLRHARACPEIVREFVDKAGGIDVLVNNAGGVYGAAPLAELTEDAWDQTFALNVKAPFFLIQQVFPLFREQGGGKIINISSVSAKYGGGATTAHYGAAKAALDALTVGLARMGAPHRILVNSIRAGFVDTDFHRKMGRTSIEERVKLIPLKRAGRPEDIAPMAIFLASSAGDYVTGEIFTISGGD